MNKKLINMFNETVEDFQKNHPENSFYIDIEELEKTRNSILLMQEFVNDLYCVGMKDMKPEIRTLDAHSGVGFIIIISFNRLEVSKDNYKLATKLIVNLKKSNANFAIGVTDKSCLAIRFETKYFIKTYNEE